MQKTYLNKVKMEIKKMRPSLNDMLAEKAILEVLSKLNLETRLQLFLKRIFSRFSLNGIGIEIRGKNRSKIDFCFPIYRSDGFFGVFKGGENTELFLENKEWQRIYKFIQRIESSKEYEDITELWFELDSPENEEYRIVVPGIHILINREVASFNLKKYSTLLGLLTTDVISPKLIDRLNNLFQTVGKDTLILYLGSFVGREFKALRVVLSTDYPNLFSFVNLFPCESELFQLIVKIHKHCSHRVVVHLDVTEKTFAIQGIEITPSSTDTRNPLLADLYHNNWCSKSDLDLCTHWPSGIKMENMNDPGSNNNCNFNFCSCELHHVKLLNNPNKIAKFYLGVVLSYK